MRFKKLFLMITTFFLIMSNVSLATASPYQAETDATDEKVLDPNEKVRIIVELASEPSITYANKAKVKFGDLNDNKKQELKEKVMKEQQFVKSDIASKSIDFDYEESFTTILNGFSGEVEYQSIDKIKALSNVKNVYIANEYSRPVVNVNKQPNMIYSKDMVSAPETWEDYGYHGEGMVVAVLDTGVDPSHRDMVLSDGTAPALTQEGVAELVSQHSLAGKYFTKKVPYGYNYADNNQEILDLGPGASYHGMHVSGTVGANGDEENDGIKGVAPEAQILAMKVFGNDPGLTGTYSDIFIKAIDDSISLGADVINMSLGDSAQFNDPENPEKEAIERAVNSGVLVAVSAGNSGQIGYGYGALPFGANPDIGVVGSPGLFPETLQVASIHNDYIDLDGFKYEASDETGEISFMSSSSVHPDDLTKKTYEVVYAGLGRKPGDSDVAPSADDFVGLDLNGKIALIQRGETFFVSKALNAQLAGAAGVIIYNHSPGYVSMVSDPEITIPQLFILQEHGDILYSLLDAGEDVSITFTGEKITSVNPQIGELAESSSWGVTPSLDFKPEITAPGVNILSTFQDDNYGLMSGTSMASPHVAGGAALVLQRVNEQFSVDSTERVQLAKNLLMNTAVVIDDKGDFNSYGTGNGYSPRRQGAGLMNLHGAMSTPVVVTEVESGEAKVALREIGDKTTFTLKAENVSNEEVTYRLEGSVLTDLVMEGVNQLESQGIYVDGTISEEQPWTGDFPITFSSTHIKEEAGELLLTVPAKNSVTFNVNVDLTNTIDWVSNLPLDEVFENGYFVEGFVKLVDTNDVNPELSIPYVGFHGDWDAAPVLDELSGSEQSYYSVAGLVSDDIEIEEVEGVETPIYNYLGYSPVDGIVHGDNLAISPNGDGFNDAAIPYLTFLRNAKEIEFSILNSDKEVIRKLATSQHVKKNLFDNSGDKLAHLFEDAAWDGTANNKQVADGLYYYEIKTKIDHPNADWQTLLLPIYVDTYSPSLIVLYDEEYGKLSIKSIENGSGVSHYDVQVNGSSVLEEPLASDVTTYRLKDVGEDDTIKVVAYDYAGNMVNKVVTSDEVIPFVVVDSPAPLTPVASRIVPVTGSISDDAEVQELKVDGNIVDFTWDAEKNQYTFATEVRYEEDGFHDIYFSAVDSEGNDISFRRTIIVDTTAPVLDIEVPTFVDTETALLKVSVADNFDELKFYINGNEEYKNTLKEPFEMRSIAYDTEKEIQLEDGKNTVVLKAVDLSGNVTEKEITIYRGIEEVERFTDVSPSYWASNEIDFLQRLSIITGADSTSFMPDKQVTRADAVVWIVNALQLDTNGVNEPNYTDVPVDHPAYKEIAAATQAGIISGSNGSFKPEDTLTRAQMAKLLSLAFELSADYDAQFTDIQAGHWAEDYINSLAAHKITTGKGNNTFGPGEETTRGQLAVFLARAINDRFIP
ncbi:S8 family serine peptidase [Cytobacillus sp. IB215316]|uniref:S8 family serine peptidase n=1 Tax=Cytobacillus sp. IB215316 TaxID=3097354 RepID=UPI002A152C00|nr:S8 family serine peptidase [Cytobacillus sp. IB215316]MDX8361171.1 S8 family serine peptidase [Cytobacillus sp. IB215316]